MRLLGLVWVIGVVPLVVACKKDDDRPPPYFANPSVPSERLPETTPAFVEQRCPVDVPGRVIQCGTVTVPEGPDSEATIDLFVARVFSDADVVQPEPVIYLDGGPGAASVGSAGSLYRVFELVAPDRDFVFFDQRGTGRSAPALNCRGARPDESLVQSLSRCHQTLSKNSDLNQYNTINNAHDVDSIRRAFGYEKMNLYGISYGTRLGLTVMRDYPEGVRAAVIDAVVPLEADLLGEVGVNGFGSFEATFAACAADPECARAYPDPLNQLVELVEKLNEHPAELSAGLLYGDSVIQVVFNALYSPFTLVYVPQMIDNLAHEDYSLFEQVGEAVGNDGIAFGMHLSLHCSEEIPFSSAAQFDSFDAQVPEALRTGLSGAMYLHWCNYWPVAVAPASENEPVVSDVPTLVMAGRFDPITPPKFSEMVHASLLDSQFFLLEGESHGASVSDCGSAIVESFLSDPSSPARAGCLDAVPDLDFQNRTRISSRTRTISGNLDMKTSPPSDEELQRALDDLRRRLPGRAPRSR